MPWWIPVGSQFCNKDVKPELWYVPPFAVFWHKMTILTQNFFWKTLSSDLGKFHIYTLYHRRILSIHIKRKGLCVQNHALCFLKENIRKNFRIKLLMLCTPNDDANFRDKLYETVFDTIFKLLRFFFYAAQKAVIKQNSLNGMFQNIFFHVCQPTNCSSYVCFLQHSCPLWCPLYCCELSYCTPRVLQFSL